MKTFSASDLIKKVSMLIYDIVIYYGINGKIIIFYASILNTYTLVLFNSLEGFSISCRHVFPLIY